MVSSLKTEDFRDDSLTLARVAVSRPLLISLTEESISEYIEKANAKIEGGDAAGAIASAYTLGEGFLKEIYRTVKGTPFKIETFNPASASCVLSGSGATITLSGRLSSYNYRREAIQEKAALA